MDSKKELEQEVFGAARDFGFYSVLFRHAIARRLGLNSTDYECLSILSIWRVATPKELAAYTGLTTGSTTAMLDRLEKAGFIRRKPNPDDRRSVLIEISDQWQAQAGPLVQGVQQAHRDLIMGYSEEELATIADFFTRFAGNVKEHARRIDDSEV